MIMADSGAELTTAGRLILSPRPTGDLHLYLAEGLSGFFEPSVPVYRRQQCSSPRPTTRAAACARWALNGRDVIAPPSPGCCAVIGIQGIMTLDVITFFAALGTLLVVRFPTPPARPETAATSGTGLRTQLTFGFRYIFARKGLLGLLLIYTCINLFAALTYFGVLPAMILTRSGGDELALASVQGALGAAGVVGGIVVSLAGCQAAHPRALGATAISPSWADFLFAAGRDVTAWVVAACVASFFIPILLAGERAIWQTKVPPEVQGRVFAAQSMVRMGMMPLGYLLAGPLADRLFEPAMLPGGALVGVFGGLVGTGPGAGMGLMFLVTCLGGTLLCLSGYAIRPVRRVEIELPDFDAETPADDSATRTTGETVPMAI